MPMERGREVAKLYQCKEALPQDLSPIQFRLPFFSRKGFPFIYMYRFQLETPFIKRMHVISLDLITWLNNQPMLEIHVLLSLTIPQA